MPLTLLPDPPPIRYASLFSGIAGAEQGFGQHGWQPTALCEIDKNCQRLLRERFPTIPLLEDVRDVVAADLGAPDLIVAGFPCQGTSIGQPSRLGLRDPDNPSFQFWQVIRLADEARPEWLVIENPDGLLRSPGKQNVGADFAAVLGALADIGYLGAYRVLDAAHYGTPQRRRRLFLVFHRGGSAEPGRLVLGDAVAGGPAGTPTRQRPRSGPWSASGADAGAGATVWRKAGRPNKSLAAGGKETWRADGEANTLAGFDWGLPTRQVHLIAQHQGLRAPTITEWERLQGFPDGWTEILGSPSARGVALGNAMHVGTLAEVARRLTPVHAAMAAVS